MKVSLSIQCDGAAFHELDPAAELARIFRSLAEAAERAPDASHLDGRAIIDANGNRCGGIRVSCARSCADCGHPAEAFRAEHDAHLCDGCADHRRDCAEAQDASDAHYGRGHE